MKKRNRTNYRWFKTKTSATVSTDEEVALRDQGIDTPGVRMMVSYVLDLELVVGLNDNPRMGYCYCVVDLDNGMSLLLGCPPDAIVVALLEYEWSKLPLWRRLLASRRKYVAANIDSVAI